MSEFLLPVRTRASMGQSQYSIQEEDRRQSQAAAASNLPPWTFSKKKKTLPSTEFLLDFRVPAPWVPVRGDARENSVAGPWNPDCVAPGAEKLYVLQMPLDTLRTTSSATKYPKIHHIMTYAPKNRTNYFKVQTH